MVTHTEGCVEDERCWVDEFGVEWHPGRMSGVYIVREGTIYFHDGTTLIHTEKM